MMDEKTKADYERAAVAFEKHTRSSHFDTDIQYLVAKAWGKAIGSSDRAGPMEDIDLCAARLLRDCLARNEELQ